MLVKDLMALLAACPQEAELYIFQTFWNGDDHDLEIEYVEYDKNNQQVDIKVF